MKTPPHWVDDLFPFPTPAALATLIDIAWEHAFDDDDVYLDYILITHYDFMFDLARYPLPPDDRDEENSGFRPPPMLPLWGTPEFVPFGHLGTGIDVGWVVPAPELDATDHPVALIGSGGNEANVIGRDTRTGLEYMLSLGLRKDNLTDADRALITRLAAELDLHPHPEHGVTSDGLRAKIPLELVVPSGWRHDPGADGIGVLAPADAFADRAPTASKNLGEILTDAAHLLDEGYPASALTGLRDAFQHDICRFPELRPLWARAYRDLGRSHLLDTLDRMLPMYEDIIRRLS